jgi:hypothetical protein
MLPLALGRRAIMAQPLPVWVVVLTIVTLFAAYGVLQWAIRTSTLRRRGQNAVHKQLRRGPTAPARRLAVAGSRRTA